MYPLQYIIIIYNTSSNAHARLQVIHIMHNQPACVCVCVLCLFIPIYNVFDSTFIIIFYV